MNFFYREFYSAIFRGAKKVAWAVSSMHFSDSREEKKILIHFR